MFRSESERAKDAQAEAQWREMVAAVDAGWKPQAPPPGAPEMQPHGPQQYWHHRKPLQSASWSQPATRMPNGVLALLWAILILLVVNLLLTLYVFSVVHQVVQGVQSLGGMFG